ncbi:MAG: hypothetical protein J7K94_04300 [Dehalococcoidia bacterium]|nr:hypothetical protein [Dehalococcoidia bacterium]
MRKWNWLQWLLFIAIIVIMVIAVLPFWAFPEGEFYPTGQYDSGGPLERQGGEVWEQLPSPESNPGWVRFIQDNEGITYFAIFLCIGLGVWIGKISSKRRDKLEHDEWVRREKARAEALDELSRCKKADDYVSWFYEWKGKGMSPEWLLEWVYADYGHYPRALKNELV